MVVPTLKLTLPRNALDAREGSSLERIAISDKRSRA